MPAARQAAEAPRATRAVRQPSQRRAQATLERILDAGAELITEHGYAGFGIADVCRRAGVSAGGLYRYFESKESLVLAVQDRELDRLGVDTAAALDRARWEGASVDAVVEGAVHALADQYRRHEPMLRAFIMHSGADPEMRAHSSLAVRDGMRAQFEALLLSRADELVVADRPVAAGEPTVTDAAGVATAVRRAVDGCFRLVFDSLSWRVGFGAGFESEVAYLDWDEWTGYLVAMARRQLLGAA